MIITGNCLEVMPTLEAGSVRLVFADPPYNQGVDYGAHHNDTSAKAYLAWCQSWLKTAVRLSTPDGSLWLLHRHEWAWQIIPIAISAGLHFRQLLTWYETFGNNCTSKFNRCSRPLLWLVKDPKRFASTIARRSAARATGRRSTTTSGPIPRGSCWMMCGASPGWQGRTGSDCEASPLSFLSGYCGRSSAARPVPVTWCLTHSVGQAQPAVLVSSLAGGSLASSCPRSSRR